MTDGAGVLLGGRYQLVEMAGEGGMAVVWRALTRGVAGFVRPVAVKRIRGELCHDPRFVQMFVEEARVGATLNHPNVVQLHDFDLDEWSHHYLVMEWVEGVDLGRWSHAHQKAGWHTPWHLTAAIGIEVLRGLHSAHSRTDVHGQRAPTYHRDVTPGNILVGLNGIVKLADFGLARAMDRAKTTQPEMVKGKVAYVAPELVAEGADPDARSDIFSLGVVLFEVLAGRRLFLRDGGDVKTLEAVMECRVPSLADARPDVPEDLVKTVRRALERDPEKRFQSAQHMARALARVLRRVREPTDAEPIAESVATARERLGLPARDMPPEKLVPIRRRPVEGGEEDSVAIPLVPRAKE